MTDHQARVDLSDTAVRDALCAMRDHFTGQDRWFFWCCKVAALLRSPPHECEDGIYRVSADELMADFLAARESMDEQDQEQAALALAAAIERGRTQLGWPICTPSVPFAPRRQRAVFDKGSISNLVLAERWMAARLDASAPGMTSDDEAIGELLLSLAFDAGVTGGALMRAVVLRLADGIRACDDLIWVCTTIRAPNEYYYEHRRVFLPWSSAMLAVRFGAVACARIRGVQARAANRVLIKCVRARLTQLGVPGHWQPGSFAAYIRAAADDLHVRLPPFLSAYASCTYGSSSVPDPAFLRLMGVTPPSNPPVKGEPALHLTKSMLGDSGQAESVNAFADSIIKVLDQTLASSDRPTALQALAEILREPPVDLPASALALLRWADHSLRAETKRSTNTSVASVRRELLRIAPHVIGVMGLDDPLHMSEELLASYSEMLDELAADTTKPTVMVRSVKRFMDFCARMNGFGPTGEPEARSAADAQMYSYTDIRRIYKYLDTGRSAACGPSLHVPVKGFLALSSQPLRTGEQRGLLRRDLNLDDHRWPTARIRQNEHRGLKTAHSKRNVPLVDFGSELLESVQALSASRHDHASGDLLFPDYRKPNEDWRISRTAQALLREVLGDPHLRPYHGRHSAASRLVLAYAIWVTGADVRDIACPFVQEAAETSQYLTEYLNRADLERDGIRVISMVLGHAHPRTTLTNYVHVLDMALYLALRREDPWSSGHYRNYSGLPKSSFYRAARAGMGEVYLAVERQKPERVLRYDRDTKAERPGASGEPRLFTDLCHLIQRLDAEPNQWSEREARFHAGLLRLSIIPSGRRGAGARHRLQVASDESARIAKPLPLGTAESRSAATDLCDCLEGMFQRYPERANWMLSEYVNRGHSTRPQMPVADSAMGAEATECFNEVAGQMGCRSRASISSCDAGSPILKFSVPGALSSRGNRAAVSWVFLVAAAREFAEGRLDLPEGH